MISKADAERIIGRSIEQPPIENIYSTSLSDWLEDVSILNFPEIASAILTEEALFVVHPGYLCGHELELYSSEGEYVQSRLDKYNKYVERLRAKVQSELGKKAILVWTRFSYKEKMLRFLGVDRNSVVLVPTDDFGSELRRYILRMEEQNFYKRLSDYVKSAELMGESSSGCVLGVEKRCKGLIKTRRIEDLIY